MLTHEARGIQWHDTIKSAGIVIDEARMSAVHTGATNTWQTALSEEVFSEGQHTWYIKVKKATSNWIFIGVANVNWTGHNTNLYVGKNKKKSPMKWNWKEMTSHFFPIPFHW